MVRFLRASPYSDVRGPRSLQSLPVRDGELEAAVQYYTRVFGFELVDDSQGKGTPAHASALLQRDDVTLGLEENGGDPEQEGAFIGVDNVEAAFAELNANGLGKEEPSYTLDWRPAAGGQPSFYNKLFFVVAPDGLCYCLGQKVLDLVREDLPLMETERWALLPPAESRDAEVHALFNDRAVMLPFLKHLYEIPDDQWCERRQRHRAGFANLDEGPLYMDLLWKETGEVVGTAGFPRPLDHQSGHIEWGINVAASHQRRGLCSEVFDRCRKLVHDRYSWAAFTAETAADNTIMRSILEKKGMKQTSSHIEDGVELVAYEDPQGRKL